MWLIITCAVDQSNFFAHEGVFLQSLGHVIIHRQVSRVSPVCPSITSS